MVKVDDGCGVFYFGQGGGVNQVGSFGCYLGGQGDVIRFFQQFIKGNWCFNFRDFWLVIVVNQYLYFEGGGLFFNFVIDLVVIDNFDYFVVDVVILGLVSFLLFIGMYQGCLLGEIFGEV